MYIWQFCFILSFSSAFLLFSPIQHFHHPVSAKSLLQQKIFHDTNQLYSQISESLSDIDAVLDLYRDEIASLRGTPELVDKLENLASKHPGIELNINTYRMIYPFPLDQFQIDGLSSLMNGNSVLVSTPTGSGETIRDLFLLYF